MLPYCYLFFVFFLLLREWYFYSEEISEQCAQPFNRPYLSCSAVYACLHVFVFVLEGRLYFLFLLDPDPSQPLHSAHQTPEDPQLEYAAEVQNPYFTAHSRSIRLKYNV